MLSAGTTQVADAEKDEGMIEQTYQSVLDALPSPRVLNTHVHHEKLPAEVFTKSPKMFYLTRNPKDIAVSLYHHHKKLWDYYSYDGTFENYLHLFVEGKGISIFFSACAYDSMCVVPVSFHMCTSFVYIHFVYMYCLQVFVCI